MPSLPEGVTRPREGYVYSHSRSCRGCPAVIHWFKTPAGKWSPHDIDGTSHFATCPNEQDFRGRKA